MIEVKASNILYLTDFREHQCTGKAEYESVFALISDSKIHRRYRKTLTRCKTCGKVFWRENPEKMYAAFEESRRHIKQQEKKVKGTIEKVTLPKGTKIYCVYKKHHICIGQPNVKEIEASLFQGKMKCEMSYCNTCKKYIYKGKFGIMLDFNNIDGWYYDLYIHKNNVEEHIPPHRRAVSIDDHIDPEQVDHTAYEVPMRKKESYSFVKPKDFLVVTSVRKCAVREHDLQDINARIRVLSREGKIIELITPAIFCRSCMQFYMLDQDYEMILRYGTPLCKTITIASYIKMKEGTFRYSEESLLHSLGYNVNAQEGLSDRERQHILSVIIDEDVMDKNDVLSFLGYLIRRNSNNERFENAREKWACDRQFVSQYKRKPAQTVDVKRITVRDRIITH